MENNIQPPSGADSTAATCSAGWQPISTAPKHGGTFLTFLRSHSMHFYGLGNYHWDEKYEIGGFRYNPAMPAKPTHWMPLPKPPQQNSPAQERE